MQTCRYLIIVCLLIFIDTLLVAAAPAASSIGDQKLRAGVTDQIQRMSLEEKIGQLFIVAPDGEIDDLRQNYHVGGFVLFDRHTPDLRQTMELIEKLRPLSGEPAPLIAVDQEGGRVARLKFATPLPPARRLGDLSPTAVNAVAKILGTELAALGFNVNFAPVFDVDSNPANPVIGDRAFAAEPNKVSALGVAYINGLHAAGIAATAKHFPGHGDTRSDSHYQLPVVDQPRDRLYQVELAPFLAAVAADVDLIMTAHVHYPALDCEPGRPATLSAPILTGLLREQMGYEGIIITDAMNMGAITDSFSAGPAAVSAFQAGADLILMPENLADAYESMLSAVANGKISPARLNESLQRILLLKARLSNPVRHGSSFANRLHQAESTVGSAAHAAEMATWLNRQ